MIIAFIVNDPHYEDYIFNSTIDYDNVPIEDMKELQEAVQEWFEDAVSLIEYKDGEKIVDIHILDTDTMKIEKKTIVAVKRPSFDII
jgi:hypothetical protein